MNSKTSFHSVAVILSLTLNILVIAQAEYLFRSSPGGDGYKSAGLWGGHLTLNHNGQGTDLYSHGYDTLNTSHKSYYGIELEYVSYDPISKQVLMVVDDPDSSPNSVKHSISYGSLCKDGLAPLHATFQNFVLKDDDHPLLMDIDCGWKCGWGPFAYYNDKTYFMLSAVFGNNYSNLKREIQLRVLHGCYDLIESIKRGREPLFDFPVLQCSNWIATIHSSKYVKPNPKPNVWVAKDMRVVERDGQLHGFVQILDVSSSKPKIDLVHVKMESAAVHTISGRKISNVYVGNLKIRGLGAIDYKDGILCWTDTDTLQCALYDLGGDKIRNTLIAENNEAGICHTGDLPQEELRKTLTGVAISETVNTLSVYFGCYADIPATGGVGLARISYHGLQKEFYQVESDSHIAYGGNLFISDTVDEGCKYGTIGQATTKVKTSPYSTADSLPSISSANRTMLSVYMLILTLLIVLM